MSKKVLTNYLVLVLMLIATLSFDRGAFAHPGRTDKYGGHYDRSTGAYHFHNNNVRDIPTYNKPFKKLLLISENEKYVFSLLNIVDMFINEEGYLCLIIDTVMEAKGYQDAAIYRNYFIIKPYKAPINTLIHITIFDKEHPAGLSEFTKEEWTELTNQTSGYTSFSKVLGYGAANGEFTKRSITLNKFVNSSFEKDINYNKALFTKTIPNNTNIKKENSADNSSACPQSSTALSSKTNSRDTGPPSKSSKSGYGLVYGFIGFVIFAIFLLLRSRKNIPPQIIDSSFQDNTTNMDVKAPLKTTRTVPLTYAKTNNIRTVEASTPPQVLPSKPPINTSTLEKSFPYKHTHFNPAPNAQNKQKWLRRNHKRHYFWLKNIFGNEVYYLSEFFLNLKDYDWKKLLMDYELSYGKNAKKYAEATYPLWRNKTVKFSYQTSNRFLTLIPPYLPSDYKYYLLQSVIIRNKSMWNNDATIEYEAALWLSIGNEDSANGSLDIVREQVRKGNIMQYHKQWRVK